MLVDWSNLVETIFSAKGAVVLSLLILALGVVLAYAVWRTIRRLLFKYGVQEAVEGTPFERTVRGLGTSTIGLVSTLAAVFVYAGAVILALNVSQLFNTALFWSKLIGYLPDLFVAIFVLIIGLIAGDKARLVVSERLRSVKVPEAGVLPELVKYSIFFLAGLIALDQLRVATDALLILLGGYIFGLIFLLAIAFKQLLAAGAAGFYLVLAQPYSIGDEVEIDDRRGIVQEVNMLVTHVENDGEEYVIPNQRVFQSGIVRIRE